MIGVIASFSVQGTWGLVLGIASGIAAIYGAAAGGRMEGFDDGFSFGHDYGIQKAFGLTDEDINEVADRSIEMELDESLLRKR